MNAAATPAISGSRLRSTLRALESRDFRLFFLGQSVSLVGTWIQAVAMSWLVYRITGSSVLLGLVSFASQLPAFFLAPVAGVLADVCDRRRVLLTTQTLALLQALLLGILVVSKSVQVWHILVMSIGLGLVNAFDLPVRQSFMVGLIDRKEDLPNAIALHATMVNSGRLLGPALSGALITAIGEAGCFFLNALSYAAAIAALFAIHARNKPRQADLKKMHNDLMEGMRYAWSFPPIRDMLLLLALTSLVGLPYHVLLPVFATKLLGAGVHTYGFLVAAPGIGALAGTLYLATRSSVLGLGTMTRSAVAIFGVMLSIFALSSSLPLSLAVLVPSGFCSMMQIAATNTILQTIVEDDKRGRVMSFFTMSFIGTNAFGSMLTGWLAGMAGPRLTVLGGGILCLIAAGIFSSRLPLLKRLAAPIYERMGIVTKTTDD